MLYNSNIKLVRKTAGWYSFCQQVDHYHQGSSNLLRHFAANPLSDESFPDEAPHGPSMDTWRRIGPQMGSNPGGLYEDEQSTPNKHYVKFPYTPEHAANEHLAGKLYQLFGIESPELHRFQQKGRAGVASKWIGDLKPLHSFENNAWQQQNAEHIKEFRKGLAVDAWLGNWDVIGMGFDNIAQAPSGKIVRLDAGGALNYRAKGSPKGNAFGHSVGEMQTLRDSNMNYTAATAFGNMSDSQIIESINYFESKFDAPKIKQLVMQFGPGTIQDREQLFQKLMKRKDNLLQQRDALQSKKTPITQSEKYSSSVRTKNSDLSGHQKEADINLKDFRAPAAAVGAAALGLGAWMAQKPQSPSLSQPTKQVSPARIDTPPAYIEDNLKLPEKIEKPTTPEIAKKPVKNIEFDAIMYAIHMMESSGGVNTKPRYEPGFEKRYVQKCLTDPDYKGSKYDFARDLVKKHGKKAAATSYGPYQVLLFEAWQLGYRVSPTELANPAINRKVAEAYVKTRCKGKNAYDTFVKYNGSSKYAQKAMKYYNDYKAKNK